jgi:centrosomal protein CEP41
VLTNSHNQKNKEDKLIVVYDEDESIAAPVATTMFQKGIDNVYLLSGGKRRSKQKEKIFHHHRKQQV